MKYKYTSQLFSFWYKKGIAPLGICFAYIFAEKSKIGGGLVLNKTRRFLTRKKQVFSTCNICYYFFLLFPKDSAILIISNSGVTCWVTFG